MAISVMLSIKSFFSVLISNPDYFFFFGGEAARIVCCAFDALNYLRDDFYERKITSSRTGLPANLHCSPFILINAFSVFIIFDDNVFRIVLSVCYYVGRIMCVLFLCVRGIRNGLRYV